LQDFPWFVDRPSLSEELLCFVYGGAFHKSRPLDIPINLFKEFSFAINAIISETHCNSAVRAVIVWKLDNHHLGIADLTHWHTQPAVRRTEP
jgi:hypothetical protein